MGEHKCFCCKKSVDNVAFCSDCEKIIRDAKRKQAICEINDAFFTTYFKIDDHISKAIIDQIGEGTE